VKKFNNQVMKFTITSDKLKMEMSLQDLVWLFHNSPNNTYDGENIGAKVKPGMRQEFAEFIVKFLMDDARNESDNTNWSEPFENAFLEIIEGAEDFCKYSIDNEE
jgi:hypothetical protein